MDLLGTFRVKLNKDEKGKYPRRWLSIDVFSKKESGEYVKYTEEYPVKRVVYNTTTKKKEVIVYTKTCVKQKWVKKDVKPSLVIRLHKSSAIVKLDTIGCWSSFDKDKLPKEILSLKDIVFVTPGLTPSHRPSRKLTTEEKQIRYDYLIKNNFPENIISVIERGYSAKDVKKARQSLAKKDVNGKKKLASRQDAIIFIGEKLNKKK